MLVAGASAVAINELLPRQSLTADESLLSDNCLAKLTMQGSDGNLVLRNNVGTVLWASYTTGFPGSQVTLQSDGNLVVYDRSGQARWSTGTAGQSITQAMLQDDCNFVLYVNDNPVWFTGTTCGNPGVLLCEGVYVDNTGETDASAQFQV